MSFDYYKAPSDAVFTNIKYNAIKLWETYDNTYGYVDEKLDRIAHIENVQDNAWYIVAMFDQPNQLKLLTKLNDEAREAVLEVLTESMK